MSVISVTERAAEQAGSVDAGDFEKVPVVTYTRTFIVRVDSALDGPASILHTLPGPGPIALPRPGQVYATLGEIDYNAFCSGLDVTRFAGDDPYLWRVEAKFSTLAPDESKRETPTAETPDAVPPEVSVDFVSYTRPLEKDLDGKAVKNAIGDPFDPPYEVEDSRPRIVVVRNQLAFDLITAKDYKDAVNSDTFGPFDPGTCRMAGISAERVYDRGFYWRVTYEIEIRDEGWQPNILNRGFRYKDGTSGLIKNVSDEEGNFSNVEVLLAEDGTKLDPLTDEPVYLDFKAYKEKDFGSLGLL